MHAARRRTSLTRWAMPAPYSDEITYSVVCRFMAQWGLQDVKGLLEQLSGVRVFATHPLSPLGILPIANAAFAGHRDPLSQVVKHHTLLPYFNAFGHEPDRARVKAVLSQHPNAALSQLVSAGPRAYGMASHLRICVECAVEQRRTRREAFWTRRHQLPGLHHCPVHSTVLLSSPVPLEVDTRFQLAPLDTRTIAASRLPQEPPLLGARLERKIAAQSLVALSSGKTNACDTSPAAYRAIIGMLGYAGRRGELRMQALEASFLRWLGTNGCVPQRVGSSRWWLRLVTEIGGATTPLQHLLLQEFIRVQWRKSREVQPELFPFALPWSAATRTRKSTGRLKTSVEEVSHATFKL